MLMLLDHYDDTKDLKLFIRIFHLFDCSNETRKGWTLPPLIMTHVYTQ